MFLHLSFWEDNQGQKQVFLDLSFPPHFPHRHIELSFFPYYWLPNYLHCHGKMIFGIAVLIWSGGECTLTQSDAVVCRR
jgi:hypothetical protein